MAQHNRKGFLSMAEEMDARRQAEQEREEEGVSQMEDIKRKDLVRKVEERRREIAEEQAKVKEEERRGRNTSESEGLGGSTVSVKSRESLCPEVVLVLIQLIIPFP